jgi:hypothetical protein
MRDRNWRIVGWKTVVLCLMGILIGCSSSQGSATDTKCNDAECFGVCVSNHAWDDYPESYWVLDAYCKDATTCECANWGCDNERCNSYCVEEQGGTGGSCYLDCQCDELPADAGDAVDGGKDAAP